MSSMQNKQPSQRTPKTTKPRIRSGTTHTTSAIYCCYSSGLLPCNRSVAYENHNNNNNNNNKRLLIFLHKEALKQIN